MKHNNRWIVAVVLLVIAGLQLAACGQAPSATADIPKAAEVQLDSATGLNRVVLTEKAAQRLDIQTVPVREEQVNGTQRKVIPYAAVIYDLNGENWAYISTAPLTFTRAAIDVDYIEGDRAVLVDGPAAGTPVVTVGVAELYGADAGIGK